jgi:prepilin-type N-terminal cleavage/methylation domain-containing protein
MYKFNYKKTASNTAFTMIELSVVILIIAILMFGSFSSTGIVNNAKEKVTKDRIDVVYKALGNFLIVNKRLPCPASILNPRRGANYGKEIRNPAGQGCAGTGIYASSTSASSSSFLVSGMLPTYDLNLGEDFAEDAFGNKMGYFIDQRFTYDFISAPDPNLTLASFGTANYKNIMWIKNKNNNGEILINSDAIVTIVSAGVNGFGAFKNTGIQNTHSSLREEAENELVVEQGFNKVFFNEYNDSESFDDIVFFKTRNDFVNDFNAMFLIPCKGNDIVDSDFINSDSVKVSAYYGSKPIFATNSCPFGVESVKKSIKCDVFGKWVGLIATCPQVNSTGCSVGGTDGMKQSNVNPNSSGNGECEQYYSGSYSWICDGAGVKTVLNSCVAYCDFSAVPRGASVGKQKPGDSGIGACLYDANIFYEWSCDISGVGYVISNNCPNSP